MAKLAKKCSAFITVVVLMVGIFSFSASAASHAANCSMPQPVTVYSSEYAVSGDSHIVAGGYCNILYIYKDYVFYCPNCGATLGSGRVLVRTIHTLNH